MKNCDIVKEGALLKTPVALLIFNRPETTKKVFEAIRAARPSKLLVVADGPRFEMVGEKERCEAVRKIIETIDWDCELLKNYSDVNMGCRARVSSGLDWVFENVEEAIILEDDCLPDQSFFFYCRELLNFYKNDQRVMHIAGTNVQFGKNRVEYDYYFTRKYFHVWGWATWRRAWKHYDVEMKDLPLLKKSPKLDLAFSNKKELKGRLDQFDLVRKGEIDTWDYQWGYSCILRDGWAIIPNVNMVSNVGFGEDATHTHVESDLFANMKRYEMHFPMKHPDYFLQNKSADNFTYKCRHSIITRLFLRLRNA